MSILLVLRVVFSILLLFVFQGMAVAQIIAQYFHAEEYRIEDGLGHGTVIDFQIDHNGLMWIYTSAGLQLFDGKNFVSFNHLISGNLTYAFFDAFADDHIYFIYGDQLYDLDVVRYSSDAVPIVQFPKSPESLRRNIILYENAKDLFVWHSNDSVYQVDKRTLTISSAFVLPVEPSNRVMYGIGNFFPDENKLMYVGVDYVLYTVDLQSGQHECTLLFTPYKSAIFAAKDTIVSIGERSIYIYAGGNEHQFPLPVAYKGFGQTLLRKNAREILVSLQSNIYTFDLRQMNWTARYQKAGGGALFDINTRKMIQDQTDNLYFSTFNDGFVHLHPRNPGFTYIGAKEVGQNFTRCVNISEEHHLVLMGTLQDGLLVFDTTGTQIDRFHVFPDGKKHDYIGSIIKLAESRFLILADDNAYLLTISSTQLKMEPIPGFNPQWSDYYDTHIRGFDPDIHFISNIHGVLKITTSPAISFEFQPNHSLNGAYAINTFNGGYISCAKRTITTHDKSFRTVTGSYPISITSATRCMVQFGPDEVLLGSDIGLLRIRVDKEATLIEKFYDKVVYAILPGAVPGEFWFSTDYGLFCLQPDKQVRHYSKETGLQENEFNTNSCVKSSTGKIYFGGVNGITAFYPSQVSAVTDTISSFITQIAINNNIISRYLPGSASNTFVVKHSENNISVDLLGRGIKSPGSYNYQYKMVGLTNRWVDLGNASKVNFHLMPGKYTFSYHISDRFDSDPDVNNGIHFVIRPPFYKSWWFISGALILLSCLGFYLLVLQRRRQMLKRKYEQELSHGLQKERMRISRELHDNIGAQMATVKRSINFIVNNSASLSSQQILQKMQDLEGVSTQINQELRDTIWATQHEHITAQDFITRLKSFVFQTLGPDSPIRVHYTEQVDNLAIFGPFVTLNLHRICQEALNNIVKHSEASDIYLSFESRDHHFVVTIRDNGKGFNIQNVHEGYGLQNIRHRAAMIEADMKFTSTPDNGTTLSITVNRLILTDNK